MANAKLLTSNTKRRRKTKLDVQCLEFNVRFLKNERAFNLKEERLLQLSNSSAIRTSAFGD